MKRFTILFILLIVTASFMKAQDTLSRPKPVRSNEVGLSVSSIFFMLAGASDFNERYSNVTFRHFLKERHAVKAFVGANIFPTGNSYEQSRLVSAYTGTVYATTEKKTPSNFQLGLGYEYILGKARLKHVLGLDLLYNNKFESEKFYYLHSTDSLDNNGNNYVNVHRLDTGAYIRNQNFNKFGLNLSYSLRYQISKRWVITASMLVSYKAYRRKENHGYSNDSQIDFYGLISDVSLFYKF